MARVSDPATGYRDWVMGGSRAVRATLLVGVFVLLGVVGLAVESLQTTIRVLATQVVTWIVLLFALYTLYAIVRSVVVGRPLGAAVHGLVEDRSIGGDGHDVLARPRLVLGGGTGAIGGLAAVDRHGVRVVGLLVDAVAEVTDVHASGAGTRREAQVLPASAFARLLVGRHREFVAVGRTCRFVSLLSAGFVRVHGLFPKTARRRVLQHPARSC